MKVRVRFFAELREAVGEKERILEVKDLLTFHSLLNMLVNIYGEKFKNGFLMRRVICLKIIFFWLMVGM